MPLLNAAVNHSQAPGRVRKYARKLLDAFPSDGKPESSPLVEVDVHKGLIEPLSKRELEILRLISEGCSNQESAEKLVITLHTVKKHSSNIFTKLGVDSHTQAAA